MPTLQIEKKMQILDDYEGNLRLRANILKDSAIDKDLQDVLWALFQKDIIAFFKLCLWTYDPREIPHDRPFIPYSSFQTNFIEKINYSIENGVSVLVEKTRDMGVTWCVLGSFLYRWVIKDDNFLVGSRKEDLVDTIGDMDTHFERLRYLVKALPQWLKDRAGVDEKKRSGYMKMWKENGASLVGESMNPDFSRQGRYKAILLDEYAFVDKAELIWRACGDSAPCKISVSTPNGSHNHFARLRKSGKIEVVTLGWRLHPKKTQKWYEKQVEERTVKDVAQEIDINYSVSAGDPFYKGFSRALHVQKMQLNTEKELILSWDYGFRHPNCSIHQIGVSGEWIIFDNIFGEDETINEFGERVKTYLNTYYKDFKIISCGDPAGNQVNDKSKYTSVQILKTYGFNVRSVASNTPQTNYDARKNIIEKKLKTLIGGYPALVVNDCANNTIIIEGFEGGYRYPKENSDGYVREEPVKDGFYEHPFNTIEYVSTNFFRPVEDNSHFKKTRKQKGRV